ncbi:brachyurin-like [Schistocerca cancellata]|uniref:brachyurin-like n=1 Tax=Schistocerca cancellata TaxID=274614 RepID=UPI002118D84B|nr:brachyurin-like [Schistocerca cancellata]
MFSLLVILLSLLSLTRCYGAPAEQQETRVVGGTEAADGEFPFVVAYIHYDVLQCTATIINEKWVLIAAHCVDGSNIPAMTIHAGSNNASDDTGVRVDVGRRFVHESFDDMALTNDIALLELKQPLTFNSKIQAATLPASQQQTTAGTTATLVGWGATETSSSSTVDKLRKVDIPVWSDEECKAAYENYGVLRENNICAGTTGKGQCNGDSGGPLIANGQQIGIVSWSEKPCASEGLPGVFTEVSYFIDWISEHISTK